VPQDFLRIHAGLCFPRLRVFRCWRASSRPVASKAGLVRGLLALKDVADLCRLATCIAARTTPAVAPCFTPALIDLESHCVALQAAIELFPASGTIRVTTETYRAFAALDDARAKVGVPSTHGCCVWDCA
jgi:hypothetical protein